MLLSTRLLRWPSVGCERTSRRRRVRSYRRCPRHRLSGARELGRPEGSSSRGTRERPAQPLARALPFPRGWVPKHSRWRADQALARALLAIPDSDPDAADLHCLCRPYSTPQRRGDPSCVPARRSASGLLRARPVPRAVLCSRAASAYNLVTSAAASAASSARLSPAVPPGPPRAGSCSQTI